MITEKPSEITEDDTREITEVSLIVQFLCLVYSACNSLVYDLIPAPLLTHSIYWYIRQNGILRNRCRRKRNENNVKKRELYELPYNELGKSGTIRLATIVAHDSGLIGYLEL